MDAGVNTQLLFSVDLSISANTSTCESFAEKKMGLLLCCAYIDKLF